MHSPIDLFSEDLWSTVINLGRSNAKTANSLQSDLDPCNLQKFLIFFYSSKLVYKHISCHLNICSVFTTKEKNTLEPGKENKFLMTV